MRLTVIGAGPAYSDRPGSTGAAYLVREAGTAVLLDLGQGSFPRLAEEIEPSLLTAVAISHLHPDHFIDLVPLRHYLRYEFRPPRRVRVIGPGALAERIDALHGEPGFAAATLDCEPLAALDHAPLILGDLSLEAGLVTHTDESHGFRVARSNGEGAGLVYSGDCGRADDLAGLIRPGDTLLSEVSFGAGPVAPGALHLDGPAVGSLAAGGRAGRVLLTHLQMGFDADAAIDSVRARFDGPVELVSPGDAFDL
jgi:ribonuclease BN (tRNA processing enzyme)